MTSVTDAKTEKSKENKSSKKALAEISTDKTEPNSDEGEILNEGESQKSTTQNVEKSIILATRLLLRSHGVRKKCGSRERCD